MTEGVMKGYRLSPPQQRLWRLQSASSSGGRTPYWSQAVVRLSGEPERRRMEEAVRRLVQRHELLRTGFAALPGMGLPLQVIAEQGEAPVVSWHEVEGRSLGRAREVLERVLAEAREQEVEWERGVGLQVAVVGPVGRGREWWVGLSLPALYGDGRGLSNVGRELGSCYAAGGGEEGAGAAAVVQYADLSEWQNELLEAEETQAGKWYWAGQDRGGEAEAQWERWSQEYGKSGGRVASEAGSEAGSEEWRPARVRVRLSGVERGSLATAAREVGVGVREWLLGCWALLWSRLSSQSRLVIATRFDGRRYEGLSQAPGLLAKYLPLHVDIQVDATMADVAQALALKCEELRKWQEYYTAEEEREQACAGICFSYAEQGWSEERAGIMWELQWEYECTQAYRFKLECEGEAGGGVRRLWLEYDSARFESGEVKELAENLRTLLAASGRAPERAVSRLALLSERQRRRLIEEVSRGPRVEVGESVGVQELFAQQVAQGPDRVAVVCGSEAVSYGELNARAERLAARLRQLGVGAESRVGLLLERSVGMVVGLLGVLKAGGAYVPMEVGYPDERVRYVVEDAGLAVVVTEASEVERVRRLGAAPVLCEREETKEAEGESGAARSGIDVSEGVSRQNLCYVIYTSGSTGRPKGVMVTHGQLLNYVSVARMRLGLGEGLRYGLLTTFAADLGHTVTFPALCTGGCLHVVATEVGLEARRLSAYLQEQEIECLKMVPSQLAALVRTGERVLPQTHLVLGGEALTEGLVERVKEQAEESTELVLYNHYGPTETTVGAVAGRVWQAGESRENRNGTQGGKAAVGLGRALGNTSVYVVDGSGEVAPQGVAGEVYIGGAGMARGYLQRPELTAERFIPDEFSAEAGARLYRTGDLARYRADGELEFLGRIDNQVKIRGYRIELGEIEAALCALAGVREAVVVARPDAQGEQRLVGYVVVAAGPAGVDQGVRLRRELGARLPDYMVPAVLVELEQLPLTANGKVDRRALPEPERVRGRRPGSEPARTPVEELLSGIWAEVLGVERVGMEDNFFELGGHSLLATQVVSRVNSAFGVEIPVGSLFDALTVNELAQRVESEIRAGKGVAAPPLVAVSRDGELPLSFAQQRLWFLDQLEPGTSLYNIFKGVRLDGVLDRGALEAALNEIISRHEVLRTTFDAIDGRPRQLIAVAKHVALKIEELSEFPDDEREAEVLRLAHEESVRPFDLTEGPLLRVRLLRLNDEEHVMLFTMHHIIGDAWSIALLVRELTTLYRAFHLGTPLALPPLPVQYADYAVWQREWLQNSALDKHVSFWKEELANAPPVLDLPTDHQRPEVTSLEGARHAAVLNEELANALEVFSRSQGVTLFMTLLAAFKILLHYLTKCDDIVIGTDVANRNHLETESVFGFFINQLVLRTNLAGDPIFHDLLKSVRKTVWAAYAHQELPFDRLVEALNPKRSLKYSPLFQVKFIFQNTGRVGDDEQSSETELSGLRLSGLPVEGITSKFDLTLNANRRPDALLYWIEYKTSLFNASTIACFAEQFELILSHVVSQPASKLNQIKDVLAESDRQRRARQEKNLKEARLKKFRGLTRKSTASAPQPGGTAL